MDKRYCANHRRSYYVQKNSKEKSTFFLRLNLCLGIMIVLIGICRLRPEVCEKVINLISYNTDKESIESTFEEIKTIAKDGQFFGNGEVFIPNEDAMSYINELEENSYLKRQKEKEEEKKWDVPVENGTITDTFGSRLNPITKKEENHKGLDIGVPLNTDALAVKSGVVLDKGVSSSYGNWVKYDTNDGYTILYAHLNKVLVEKGEKVEKGQVIALTGSTGNSTGPHLHYEIMENGEHINPYEYYMEGLGESLY